jgi:hypothetical protein
VIASAGVRRPWLALFALAAAGGCHGGQTGPAPPPSVVAQVDPCRMLPARVTADLGLGPGEAGLEAHRRSCRYPGPKGAADTSGAVVWLDLVLRASDADSVVADARRLAEGAQREYDVDVSTVVFGDRPVFQVFAQRGTAANPYRPVPVCSLFFTVSATSSLQARLELGAGSSGCPPGPLEEALAAALPAPGAERARPSDRPPDLAAVAQCGLLTAELRAPLGLSEGLTFEPDRGCSFSRAGPDPDGALRFVLVQPRSGPARSLVAAGARSAPRAVHERPTYEWTETFSDPPASSCDHYFEVTEVTAQQLSVVVGGADPAPACRILATLTGTVESRLPPDTA